MENLNLHNPKHISFIMSGNRRWGAENGKSAPESHRIGARNMEKIAEICFEIGVKTVSFWGMSPENFAQRPKKEIDNLIKMADEYSRKYEKGSGIRFVVLGDLSVLKLETKERCERAMRNSEGKENTMIIFFNYGGHQEILRATKKLISEKINPEKLTEQIFASKLYTEGVDQVDLIVRTGGEQRLSGFLSWQSAYAELYFIEKKWPEMNKGDVEEAIKFFQKTKRNFGK